MTKTVKCENCGANMNTDTENAMRFCPFCGNAIKLPEDYVDLAKFTMKHEESVRRQKASEREKDDKRFIKFIIGFFVSLILIIVIINLVHGNADAKLEKAVAEVQQMILDGNYDEALVMAQSIRVEKEGIFDDRYARWENQRKDLIRLIEQKKKESGK